MLLIQSAWLSVVKDAFCLQSLWLKEHFEKGTLMMVREAWKISVQMRGNLCTRCFLASKDLWLSKKKKSTSTTVVSL